MCLQTFHGVEKTPLFYYNNQHQEKRFGGSKKGIRFSKKFFETHRKPHGYWVPVISVTKDIMWRQKRCLLRKARLYRAFLLPKRRFFSVPKRRCKIAVFPLWIDLNSRKVNIRYARQIEIKNLSAFSITLKRRNQICYRKN